MSRSRSTVVLSCGIVGALGSLALAWYLNRQSNSQRKDDATTTTAENDQFDEEGPIRKLIISSNDAKIDEEVVASKNRILSEGSISIVHASVTGTCAKFASTLLSELLTQQSMVQMGHVSEWDWWDELLNHEESNHKGSIKSTSPPLLILLLPTYTNGTWPPEAADTLEQTLKDLQNDWRIESQPLKPYKFQVAIFGMGSSEYNNTTDKKKNSMGRPARECVRHFQKLGAKCIVRVRVGDDAVGNDGQEQFAAWKQELYRKLQKRRGSGVTAKQSKSLESIQESEPKGSNCGCSHKNGTKEEECCQGSPDAQADSPELEADDEDSYDSEEEEDENEPPVLDLEDMGDALESAKKQNKSGEAREMVTPRQAQQLKKEGYKLIGTHSAVKLCRWTKHQLRGRGGCYKHTFYGITSYQCMEATPSLACANKCVFCWRHHKNPVGKEWRWKTDDPTYIVDQAVQTHVKMIKETKGIPGVRMDRWKEAHTVRHCALSLVGEPIMYPRINEFLSELHLREISTFLVTNGQHPQAIGNLVPITQLYVSVDAPTKDSLIAIDRPLFNDAWERLKESLVSLKDKGQRTVARLTVVKGWNSDEVEGYAKLIALGLVSLVEMKGVTFCGKSDASNLNMSNSPWHHEVVELASKLKEELDKLKESSDTDMPTYELACEHKHSCSVLLARTDQFSVVSPDGKREWHTWIDYPKFQELAAKHEADPSFTFGIEDYTAPTPQWALFGAEEEGFDPTDTRHRKANKQPKYTQYDAEGIPTHDYLGHQITDTERERLRKQMNDRKREIGAGSTVTELRGGEKEIQDASLMFRGLVVSR